MRKEKGNLGTEKNENSQQERKDTDSQALRRDGPHSTLLLVGIWGLSASTPRSEEIIGFIVDASITFNSIFVFFFIVQFLYIENVLLILVRTQKDAATYRLCFLGQRTVLNSLCLSCLICRMGINVSSWFL